MASLLATSQSKKSSRFQVDTRFESSSEDPRTSASWLQIANEVIFPSFSVTSNGVEVSEVSLSSGVLSIQFKCRRTMPAGLSDTMAHFEELQKKGAAWAAVRLPKTWSWAALKMSQLSQLLEVPMIVPVSEIALGNYKAQLPHYIFTDFIFLRCLLANGRANLAQQKLRWLNN